MNNNFIEKWTDLKRTLTVTQESFLLCSAEDIDETEKDLGFKFPGGYKEYSSIFGSGSLGIGEMPDEFRIYCPCCPQNQFDIRETGYNLIGLKLDLEATGLSEADERAKIAYHLLENGYAFADTPGADVFFWDLSSYRDDDQSYDIYWKADENSDAIKLVGRDFFEFVVNFCLGNGLETIYSEADDGAFVLPESEEKFFSGFVPYEENNNSQEWFINHLFEDTWNSIKSSELFEETAVVIFEVSYNAADEERTECLKRVWIRENAAVKIKTIQPSQRAKTPRLIEVKITEKKVTKKITEEVLERAITIGKECKCSIGGFGSRIDRNN